MVNFLVSAADFLAFAMRLVSEDIIWLKDYCSSLTNWQCGLFLAYCFLFVVIVKCSVALAAFLLEKLYYATFSSTALYRLSFKLRCSNSTFCDGYRAGFEQGRIDAYEAEKERADHPIKYWWRYSNLNPSNWF